LRSVNLGVRLLCELALLVALAVWGFHVGSGLASDLVLGPGGAAAGRDRVGPVGRAGVAAAPRRPGRLLVEVLLFVVVIFDAIRRPDAGVLEAGSRNRTNRI
jgi:hypothetical protein